jgi:hypothetical protein
MKTIEFTNEELVETYLSIISRKQILENSLHDTETTGYNITFWENIIQVLTQSATKINNALKDK